MEIVFILVEPAVPENIGSAARALKTMGFSDLRLINTTQHLADEANWLAHGSQDVLSEALVFDKLQDAMVDIDFAIGTTAKNRSVKFDYYTPEQAKELIEIKNQDFNKVAIVFGREESGLTNEELSLCDMAVSIPLFAPYPSINLAQAVMIMAYVFSNLVQIKPNTSNNIPNYVLLKQKTTSTLESIGIKQGENLHNRIMERLATVSLQDINLILSVLEKIDRQER